MKRVTIGGVVGSVIVGAIGLYILAGRSPAELRGFVRASAGKTIDDIKDQIPNETVAANELWNAFMNEKKLYSCRTIFVRK